MSILFGALVFGLLVVVAWQFLTPKGTPSCRSFGSYEDAQSYFIAGLKGDEDQKRKAMTLDGDKDGIPCEYLIQ